MLLSHWITKPDLENLTKIAKSRGVRRSQIIREALENAVRFSRLTENSASPSQTDDGTEETNGLALKLKDLILSLPFPAYLKNSSGRLLLVNPIAAKELSDQTAADLVGKPEDILFVQLGTNAVANHAAQFLSRSNVDAHITTTELIGIKRRTVICANVVRIRIPSHPESSSTILTILKPLSDADEERCIKTLAPESLGSATVDGGFYVKRIQNETAVTFQSRSFRRCGMLPDDSKIFHSISKQVDTDKPDDGKSFLRVINEAPPGECLQYRFRHWVNDNEYAWVLAHAFTLDQEDGTRFVFVAHERIRHNGLATDVGRLLLDKLPGYVFVKSAEGRFLYMNSILLKWFDKTLKQVYGKTDSDLIPNYEECQFFRKADKETMNQDAPGWRLIPRETLTFPGKPPKKLITIKVSVPASLLDPSKGNGNEKNILGISLESTKEWEEIHEYHQLWKLLMEFSSDAIYVKDKNLRYKHVSKSFCNLLGVPGPEHIIGKTARELWLGTEGSPNPNAKLVDDMEKMDRDALVVGDSIDVKNTFTASNESQLRITTKSRLSSDSESFERMIGISRDITDVAARICELLKERNSKR
ncbi:MAG: PAS domain-containing protein [Verrucomicrobiota bacterium]